MDTKNFASDVLDVINSVFETEVSAILTIDVEHAKIHQGDMFQAFLKRSYTSGVTAKISIVTSNKEVHFRLANVATSAEDFTVSLYENGSTNSSTSSGTLNIYNFNRGSARTASITIKQSATITSDGTLIDQFYNGGTGVAGGKSGGADSRNLAEILMNENTNYSLSILSGTATTTALIKMVWYEVNE